MSSFRLFFPSIYLYSFENPTTTTKKRDTKKKNARKLTINYLFIASIRKCVLTCFVGVESFQSNVFLLCTASLKFKKKNENAFFAFYDIHSITQLIYPIPIHHTAFTCAILPYNNFSAFFLVLWHATDNLFLYIQRDETM